jgi:amphiphysin
VPVRGAGPDYVAVHEPVETPQENIDRVARLQGAYEELKNDLLDEVNQIDARIIQPAMDARDSIQPLKKVIKRRQDRKVAPLPLGYRCQLAYQVADGL